MSKSSRVLLLTTTSIVSILVASHGANAAGQLYTNPLNSTVPYIHVESSTVDEGNGSRSLTVDAVVNNGAVSNTDGRSGIRADSENLTKITNSSTGTIDVTDESTTDSGRGARASARGVRVESADGNAPVLDNQGSISAAATAINYDNESSKKGSAKASARARGIDAEGANGVDGTVGISNRGSVTATANAGAFVGVAVPDINGPVTTPKRSRGNVDASAVGINVSDRNSSDLNGISSTGTVDATATGSLNLAAYASGGHHDAEAEVSSGADVRATGIRVQHEVIDGAVTTGGTINATATTTNDGLTVTASHDDGDAKAISGNGSSDHGHGSDGEYSTSATGVDISSGWGNISSGAAVNAVASSTGSENVSATASDDARAEANRLSEVDATGVRLDIGSISADDATSAANSGAITASATSSDIATVTADAGDKARVKRNSETNVSAAGLLLNVSDGVDTLSNSGDITVTADINPAPVVTTDVVDAPEPFYTNTLSATGESAKVSAHTINSSDAIGAYLTSAYAGEVSNSGDITVGSTSYVGTLATADGVDKAKIRIEEDNDVTARGLNVAVGTIGDTFSNSGSISATATATTVDNATATTTIPQSSRQDPVGVADIQIVDGSTSAVSSGLAVNTNQFGGPDSEVPGFSNSGSVSSTAAASNTTTAVATGQEAASAVQNGSTGSVALGTQVGLDVSGLFTGSGNLSDIGGLIGDIGQVQIGGGYENSGAITADAQTTIDRTLTASAANARAGSNTDNGLQLDGYAISAGQIVVAGDIGGDFANSGAITATSGINHTDVFTANGENEAAAGAGYIGDDVSLSLPLSVSLSLGSVLVTPHVAGDISNTADVSASSTVNTDQTFDATATNGDATAGAINLQAAVGAGLISVAQYVEGEFSNTANIDGTAVSTNTVTATATGSEHARVGAGDLNIALAVGAEVDSIGGVLNHLVGAASDILGLNIGSAPFATDGSYINGVSNTGAISASATATQTETFTATIGAGEGDSSGNAEVQKYLGVNAAISSGLGVNYDTLQTGFTNTGAIQSDATAVTTANYTATNGRSSENQGASVDAGFSTTLAIASGLQLSAQQIYNEIVPLDISGPIPDVVSNSGDVTVNATATYDLTGTATADNGEAWVANTNTNQFPTVGAVASGVNVTAGYVDGNVTNSGGVAVTAAASGTTSETAASDYFGSATSGTNVNASANGVTFVLGEVNGGVSNTGSISAAANADYTTNLTAPDSVDGFVNLASYAEGLGVYPVGSDYNTTTIGGDLNVGSGDITASAHSAGTLNATTTAQSEGLYVNAQSTARGVELIGSSIDGALLSDANIQTSAFSSATVTGPQTDTSSSSAAWADGINAYWDEIGNGVDIGGTVGVTGTAVTDTTSGGADAYASVGGISLSSSDDYLSVTGDINLSAAVSASTKADATGTGALVSNDSDYDGFDSRAYTSGVYVSELNLDGNLTNTGRIGILSEASSTHVLSVDATDLEFCGGAAARTIDTEAYSEGFVVEGEYIAGNFLNSGVIGSGATADTNVTLSATGLDGQTLQQYSEGTASSKALGFYVGEIDGSVTNSGYLSAVTTNTNNLTISSPDDSASAIYAEAYGSSYATGFIVSYDSYEGGIIGGALSNSGSMLVQETDTVTTDVQSDTVDGYANARSNAYAVGFTSYGNTVGSVDNSGQLDVISTSTATAAGTSQPSAYSYAEANGVTADWGLVNADVSNSGALNVSASATADAGTGFAGSQADATGFVVRSHGINDAFDGPITTISGSIINTGAITVAANATATGSNIEPALINQMSQFSGTYAYSAGISLEDVVADGSLGNTGNINSTAVATGTNGVQSSADAAGINVQTSSIASGITNSGLVNASATADYAQAGGLIIADGTVVENSVSNTGTISATATGTSAQGGAAAYGVAVWGAAIDGSLNNSGTISAVATGPGALSSTGILIYDGGSVTSINNTGQISAQKAIDLTSASLGTAINQLNGTITGSIDTSNENEDVINWSGGKIVGDISGDSLDTLNIFAGNSNLFTYNNNIDGLGAINIGNGGAQTGAYLAGNVTNTNSLNVNNGGVLYVGTSTSIGVENFNQSSGGSSVYNLNPVTNGNGLITATNVNLAGGVTAVLNDGIYRDTLSYHVIALNEGGSLNGSYSSYSIQNALGEDVFFLDLTGQYDATGATLLVTKVPFASAPGLSDNGRTLSGALDQLYNQIDPNSADGQLLSKLVLLTPAQYDNLANQAAGSINTQSVGQTIQIMDSLGSNIQSQINEQRGGNVFASNDGGQTFKLMVADNQVSGVMNDAGSPYAVAAAKAGWDGSTISPDVPSKISVWTRVFGDWSNLNSSGGNAGYSSTGGGVLVGADYLVTPKAVVGLAGGYQNNNLNFSDGAGSGSVKSWSLTAYGDYDFGKLYVSGLAGYAWQTYTTDRFIYVPSVLAANAHSVRDGDSISASAETGYTVDLPAAVTLQPYLGLAYTYASTDGAQETGAGLFNLSISDADQNSLRSTLGLRVSKPLQFDSGMKFTPSVELGWRHEFLDTNAQLNQALTAAPGATFSVNGTSVSRDSAVVGGGVAVNIAKAVDVSLEYRGQFNSDYQDNLGGLKVRVKF